MKKLFKLSLSLLGNQFLASVGGFMCIIFVWFIAGDSIASQLVFLVITFPFFAYIEYRAAFNAGFHDEDRRNAPNSKKFLWKGALAGLISAIPLYLMIILFTLTRLMGNIGLSNLIKIYTRMISMYYNWPMCNMFPNHSITVLLTSMIWVILFPTLGYIAGYKNVLIFDWMYKLLRIQPKDK